MYQYVDFDGDALFITFSNHLREDVKVITQNDLALECKLRPGKYRIVPDDDQAALREAGLLLAEAASHVIREYDGIHRLSLAVAAWYKTVADLGGRG